MSLPQASSEQRGMSATAAVSAMALLFGGPLLCFYYVSCERCFYWWDFAIYHNLARDSSAAFGTSLSAGLRYIGGTLQADYNAVFTLPLVPFLRVFGAQRGVYLAAVYFVYLLPLLYVCGLILKEISPHKKTSAVWVGAAIAFLSPGYWRALLRGYPDTVGAMLIAVGALLHVRRQAGVWRWRESALIGVALGMSVVLRRHYAYGAVAFQLAVGLDLLCGTLADSKGGLGERSRELGRRLLHVLASCLLSVLVVAVITPSFGGRALQIMTTGAYASWESTRLETAKTIIETVGVVPALLAVLGGILHWRSHAESRPQLRFFALLTLVWLCVWTFVVRQAAYHYPHVVPLMVALGVSALLLRMMEAPPSRRRRWSTFGVAGAVVAMFLHAAGNAEAFARLNRLPAGILPGEFRPIREPAQQEQRALVEYLRSLGEMEHPRVVVAASSTILNYDLLRNAEAALYRRPRIDYEATPQVDSIGELPTSALLRADYVVVSTPFQSHIAADRQKVVRVLVDAFQERWEVSSDFELLPHSFALPHTGETRVWKRIRETPADRAYRTDARIARYVAEGEPTARAWHLVTSNFQAFAELNPDGTTKLSGHPARADAGVQTTFQTIAPAGGAASISGVVHFYDERCVGAELLVTTDAPNAEMKSLGVFTPKQGRATFHAALAATDRQAIRLLVKSAPTHPQEIDFCTLYIEELGISGTSP